jgi:hypothetical protein
MKDSERLARRYFSLFGRGETTAVLDLVHPGVEIVLKSVRPGEVLRGREQVAEFVEDVSGRFYESHADVFRPLDDEHVIVEGRLRWMDEQRVLRDDPMIWALEFREGLLYRSAHAQSIVEAEALLSGSRSS